MLLNTPRWMRCSVILATQRSTWLSQEARDRDKPGAERMPERFGQMPGFPAELGRQALGGQARQSRRSAAATLNRNISRQLLSPRFAPVSLQGYVLAPFRGFWCKFQFLAQFGRRAMPFSRPTEAAHRRFLKFASEPRVDAGTHRDAAECQVVDTLQCIFDPLQIVRLYPA
jgi:hypothetical protein